jgi:cell division protease FtsH
MYTREYLVKQIMVALGGRAAEEIVYGPDKVTTGASSDYAMVYTIAKEMVTTYGFGTYKFDYRDMSNESKYLVDKEINTIVDMCYAQVIDVLNTHRDKLEFLKDKLIEEEIIDGACVYQMFTNDDCSEFECSVDFT